MAASGVGGLTVPLLSEMVDVFGWREVLFAIGVGFWIIGFPVVALMRQFPEDYGMRPDGDPPEPSEADRQAAANATAEPGEDGPGRPRPRLKTRRLPRITTRQAVGMRFFWQLALVSSFGQFASASNITHIDAIKETGMSATVAAFAVGSVAIGDLAGRLAIAAYGDRINKRMILAATFGLEGAGIFALAIVNTNILGFSLGGIPLPLYSIGFGLGFGASVPIRLALLADYFGRESYGNVLGLVSSINAIFGAFGAAFAGLMFDLTDTYRIAFLVMAGLLVVSVPLTVGLESEDRFAARNRRAQARARPQSSQLE
jgi:cyanate permease